MVTLEKRDRIIEEFVPGKQITLSHIIAHPDKDLYQKLGLSGEYNEAVGILTLTPSEAAIIAGDVATKSGNVKIGFMDRFSGALVIVGDIGSVETALDGIILLLRDVLNFTVSPITKS
ncbi:BMC domain-containing protein [Clostridium sp. AWRP]|uniref:ethanolamine utilization microcompartment protein EutS n=1 Tax=Clostridium sp. AWRP TaxID=2212991 RepID=UPI000FD84601|nr:BMC domain-containing protein [Clostridium sp. AWRP]AZV58042.1 ethanolamine utilization microcompartment protein EutS [Clostridium sp. AWRP]